MEEQKTKFPRKNKPEPILGDPPKLADKIVIVKGGIQVPNQNTNVPLLNITAENLHIVFTNWQAQAGYPPIPLGKEGDFTLDLVSSSAKITCFTGELELDSQMIVSPDGHGYNVDIRFSYEGEEHTLRSAHVELRTE